jgi:hypothetical protein
LIVIIVFVIGGCGRNGERVVAVAVCRCGVAVAAATAAESSATITIMMIGKLNSFIGPSPS